MGKNLSHKFFEELKKHKSPTSIYLVTGHHMKGQISDCDEESIMLNKGDQKQLVFKQAIASVSPLLLKKEEREEEEENEEENGEEEEKEEEDKKNKQPKKAA